MVRAKERLGPGTQYLPEVLQRMKAREHAPLVAFQLTLVFWTLASLKAMEPDFHAIGITVPRLRDIGREKQLAAFDELWSGHRPAVNDFVNRLVEGIARATVPGVGNPGDLGTRWRLFRQGMADKRTA